MQRMSGQFSPVARNAGPLPIGAQRPDIIAIDTLSSAASGWSPDGLVFPDGSGGTVAYYATNASYIPNPPHGITVYGWTIQYNGAECTNAQAEPTPVFARWGDVWGGLIIDPAIPSGGSMPQLPPDLSTFAKLWTPDSPPWPMASWTANTPLTDSPGGLTYMLPAPVELMGGQQLAMVLTLLRSLGKGVRRIVWRASWTILYEFTGSPFAP